jgi:hypothetical protein
VEENKPAHKAKICCNHDEDLLKQFITNRVCQKSKKISKNKQAAKSFVITDSNDNVVQIISKSGRLAAAHEIMKEETSKHVHHQYTKA